MAQVLLLCFRGSALVAWVSWLGFLAQVCGLVFVVQLLFGSGFIAWLCWLRFCGSDFVARLSWLGSHGSALMAGVSWLLQLKL